VEPEPENSASTLAPDSPKKVRAFGSGSSYGSTAPVKNNVSSFPTAFLNI